MGRRSAGLAGTAGVGRAGTCRRRQPPHVIPFLAGRRIRRALRGPRPSKARAPRDTAHQPAQQLLRRNRPEPFLLNIKLPMTEGSWLAKGLAKISHLTLRCSDVC